MNKFFGHIKNILIHKYWVFYYCKLFKIPWQGITHDLSKFSITELSESIKYYQGSSSPIPVCKKAQGYSKAWLHHKGRNKHHYEYWTDNYDKGTIPIQMPAKYILEMIADWFAAGKTYMKDKFTIESEYYWWVDKKNSNPCIHPITIKVINAIMKDIKVHGFKNIKKGGIDYVNFYINIYNKYQNYVKKY